MQASGMPNSFGPAPGQGLFLVEAFLDLCTCREQGSIPITAIFDYADRYGFDDRFVYSIRQLDEHFMEQQIGKSKISEDTAKAAAREVARRNGGAATTRGGRP